jgi:hypothetical protein
MIDNGQLLLGVLGSASTFILLMLAWMVRRAVQANDKDQVSCKESIDNARSFLHKTHEEVLEVKNKVTTNQETLNTILHEAKITNSRITKLETWQKIHDATDPKSHHRRNL